MGFFSIVGKVSLVHECLFTSRICVNDENNRYISLYKLAVSKTRKHFIFIFLFVFNILILNPNFVV